MGTPYMVGLDVGSTTVKAIVAEIASDKVVWSRKNCAMAASLTFAGGI